MQIKQLFNQNSFQQRARLYLNLLQVWGPKNNKIQRHEEEALDIVERWYCKFKF